MRTIYVSLLLTTFAGLVGLGWGVDWLYSRYIMDDQTTETSHYENIGQQLAFAIDNLQAAELYINEWNNGSYSKIQLLSREDVAIPEALLQKLEYGEALTLQSLSDITIYYYLPKHDAIMLFLPTDLQPSVNERSGSGVLTFIFYSGVLVFLLAWLYPLVSRLTMMSRLTQRLGRGDLTVRMPLSVFSYTHKIEGEFNRMAASIESLVADNKLLSSAVSHDLRTPLSRIRFGVDTLSEANSQSEKDEYIAHLNQDIDEMESLVAVLLDYSKMNHDSFLLEKKRIDFGCLVSNCIKLISDADSRLTYVEPKESVWVEGIERQLRMLINNIIQNALRYGLKTVSIYVENTSSSVKFVVEDDGPGIPNNERTQVLNPFVRGEHVSHVKQGHGMGLAIANRVVQWHGGTIKIEDSIIFGGAMLTVHLATVS